MSIKRSEIPDLLREAQHPDRPKYREAYWAMLHRDENGRILPMAHFEAVQQAMALRIRIGRVRSAVAGIPVRSVPNQPTAGLNPNHSGWTELGPTAVGGRTRAIASDPKTPNLIWVGSVGGGVWRSDNAGTSFTPVDDLMANLVVSTIVIDPRDSNVIYAGTGEGFFNGDALRGAGIFRTTDGKKWVQLKATATVDLQFVNRLAITSDGKTLLAATRTGIFASTDDARNTWLPRFSANIADVKAHPTDSKRAIAGGLDTGSAYYSEDGGQTWLAASHAGSWARTWEDGTTSLSRVEVAYSRADPNVVYASVDNNQGEIWRSSDGGKTYSKMDSLTADGFAANYLGSQGWYGNAVWAGDPTNPNFVVVGGINLWKVSLT